MGRLSGGAEGGHRGELASITKEITAAASTRHRADIAAAEETLAQAKAVGIASEETLAIASRANQEATRVIAVARP